MCDSVLKTVRTIKEIGKRAYDEFFKEPINKNKLPLFSLHHSNKLSSRSVTMKKALKNGVRIFSPIVIATHTKNGGLDSFFRH